jgi:hypothetical protein
VGDVESGCQDFAIRDRPQPSGAEFGDDARALVVRGLPRHRGARDAALAQDITYMPCVGDPAAENEPTVPAPGAVLDDLVDGELNEVFAVGGVLQFSGGEFVVG